MNVHGKKLIYKSLILKILLSSTFKEVIELTHRFGLELKDFII